MLKNVQVQNQPTNIITAGQNKNAIILLSISNISQADKTVEIYAVQSGKAPVIYDTNLNVISGNVETIFIP